MSTVPHKKNLRGGKGHKRQSNKESPSLRKNRELTGMFIEGLETNSSSKVLTIARVLKSYGAGRMEIITLGGSIISAGIKGSLTCGKGSKNPGNTIAIFPGTFILLQIEDYGNQIVGVFNNMQKHLLEKLIPNAPRGFFSIDDTIDEGFEFEERDEEDEEFDAYVNAI